MTRSLHNSLVAVITALFAFTAAISAQPAARTFSVAQGGEVEIVNPTGRIYISTREGSPDNAADNAELTATSDTKFSDSAVKLAAVGGRVRIEVESAAGRRIDLTLAVPERTRIRAETLSGEVRIEGNVQAAIVKTITGTIAVAVPTNEIKYQLTWLTSRPRYVSDFVLEKVREQSAGKFEIRGTYKNLDDTSASSDDTSEQTPREKPKKRKTARKRTDSGAVALNFTTDRGIVLLNVPPNEVSSDLRERPLTEAAKAMVKSGDPVLRDAIRRASPKYFGEYASTLPTVREPQLQTSAQRRLSAAATRRAVVRVSDQFNRSVTGLAADDFLITESGTAREIVKVDSAVAPFNLVLLVDVSGSVDNYVNFIRKAARQFVNTVSPGDRVSIVLFNDDVKVLSKFTTDRARLSESLDTFDAGGATAYYDALAYTISETLRPLKGERTAIVILSDGDDNRSFLSFDAVTDAVEESGALIYPLYVPSALIAATGTDGGDIDPLRSKYIGLTTKAESEGARLAEVSGGVYYPISQLSQIQTAYDDIVVQLRTSYAITYKSDESGAQAGRTTVRVKRPGAFAAVTSITRID